MWKGRYGMARPQKRKQQQPVLSSPQPYDHALKGLMKDHAAEIVPELVADAKFIKEVNSEIKRENMRADLVYFIRVGKKRKVLNLELQTNSDPDIVIRLLQYHVELYDLYRLPVISVVLYLFETTVPASPFREDDDEDSLTFPYRPIALWTLDARVYLHKRVIGMYMLLPGMKGANAGILLQAIDEMAKRYSGAELGYRLRRFRTILRRSNTVSEQDKQIVEEKMSIEYDSLIDEDPEVKERVAKGEAEGEIKGLQKMAIKAVEDQYPTLEDLAQRRIVAIRKPETLMQLVQLIYKAPNEDMAHWLLENFAA